MKDLSQLLIGNLKYIMRAKLVYLVVLFSFVFNFIGLKLANHLTLSIQGSVSVIGPREIIFTALIMQLFTGSFLMAIYGIWMAPYSHRGDRGVLTFVLPVSKWYFPLCYALCASILVAFNHIVMLLCYGNIFGWSALFSSSFPWILVLKCLGMQQIALVVLMLCLSIGSLVMGQISTFFLGGISIFVLQVIGGMTRVDTINDLVGTTGLWGFIRKIYLLLPPIGELGFTLEQLYFKGKFEWTTGLSWMGWLVLSISVFRYVIRYPLKVRSTEA